MELHLANPYKLCCICGGKVVTKRVYVNAKPCSDYVDLLRTCFGILPSKYKEVSENLNLFGSQKIFEGIRKVLFVSRWGERLYGGTYLQRGEDLFLQN